LPIHDFLNKKGKKNYSIAIITTKRWGYGHLGHPASYKNLCKSGKGITKKGIKGKLPLII